MYQALGSKIPLPNIDGFDYLISHFHNLGMVEHTGMGAKPLSFVEINAYAVLQRIEFLPYEVIVLRQMSQQYLQFLNDENPATQAPYKE